MFFSVANFRAHRKCRPILPRIWTPGTNGNEFSADITGTNRELASGVAVPLSKEASYRVVILCRQIAAQAHHSDRVLQQVVTVTVFSRFRSGGTARTSTRPRRSRSCGRARTSRASRGRVAARPTWLRRGRRRHATGRRAARGLRRRALTGRRMAGRRRSGSACSASAPPATAGCGTAGHRRCTAGPPSHRRRRRAARVRGRPVTVGTVVAHIIARRRGVIYHRGNEAEAVGGARAREKGWELSAPFISPDTSPSESLPEPPLLPPL